MVGMIHNSLVWRHYKKNMRNGVVFQSCGHVDHKFPRGWSVIYKDQTREENKAVSYAQWCTECYGIALLQYDPYIFPDEESAYEWLQEEDNE